MIEGTMKCYKCGKRSYDDNACLDEETGLPCWRSPTEEDGRMAERSYWYLGVSPISVPYWSDVTMCEAEFGNDRVVAPMIFSTREAAEAELRAHRDAEADAYLRAVEMYGEEDFGRALDNTPEQQLFEISAWLLGEHLKASDHNYVMMDGGVRLAWELADELHG